MVVIRRSVRSGWMHAQPTLTTPRETMTAHVSERADWYAMEATEMALTLEVDPQRGLNGSEVEERVAKYGMNRLAEGEKESGFRAFLRQYEDFMQIVLLVAAAVNQL